MGHHIYILRISDSTHTKVLHFTTLSYAHNFLKCYVNNHVQFAFVIEQDIIANEICDTCCVALGKPILSAYTDGQQWTASIARVPLYDNESATSLPCENNQCDIGQVPLWV
jgi:hypothetical protein